MSFAFAPVAPVVNPPIQVMDAHLSYGQSWRSNAFDTFSGPFPMPWKAVMAGALRNVLNQPGRLTAAAGINYSQWLTQNTITGVTEHAPTDPFTIGTCATIARKLLAIRDGALTPDRTLEMCFAYPGSTWLSGNTGGLAPGASVTASITNDVMTVSAVSSGTVVDGQLISGPGIPAPGPSSGYCIMSNGTGTGGPGTYNCAIGQLWLETQLTVGTAVVIASMAHGLVTGNVMIVTSVVSGTINVGDNVQSPPALAGSKVSADLGGGSYQVTVGTPVTIASGPLQTFGGAWRNMGIVTSQMAAAMPAGPVSAVSYSSFGYTQGSAANNTEAGKLSDLNAMLALVDALNLPGAGTTGMKYYIGLPSAITSATTLGTSTMGTYDFCRTNAPGRGGPWSGRCFATSPSYAWQFNGNDNIHTGDYGTVRWGENEGYIRHLVQDQGVAWTPLWRPLTGGAITVSGQVITIPFAAPSAPFFAGMPLSFKSDPIDGIKIWPGNGFYVLRGGTPLTLSNVAISGLNVSVTVSETLTSGNVLEVSYAFRGPGGPDPGFNSGVGGNLVMNGPASVLYPNGWNGTPKTIDAWAWPFVETVTA